MKNYTRAILPLFLVIACVLYACKQENNATPDRQLTNADGTFSDVLTDPCASCDDQSLYKTVGNSGEVVGNVAICQTLTQLTLTFTVSGDRQNAWFSKSGIKVDPDGTGFQTLSPSDLEQQTDHADKVRSFTYTVLFSDLIKADGSAVVPGDKICLAAYAVVPGPDGAGGMVWAGQAAPVDGNPNSQSFCYEIKTCETPVNPTPNCFFSQGYYFAKPTGTQWPVATITFGGHEYNYEQARAIFFGSNKKGKTDAKQAFLQGMAYKLNLEGGVDPAVCVNGTSALATIEAFFSGKSKQTDASINGHTANSSLKSAAGLISNCIKENHCDSQ